MESDKLKVIQKEKRASDEGETISINEYVIEKRSYLSNLYFVQCVLQVFQVFAGEKELTINNVEDPYVLFSEAEEKLKEVIDYLDEITFQEEMKENDRLKQGII